MLDDGRERVNHNSFEGSSTRVYVDGHQFSMKGPSGVAEQIEQEILRLHVEKQNTVMQHSRGIYDAERIKDSVPK